MANWNYNFCVYLLTNKYNTVIYTGMTNNLEKRTAQHKSQSKPGFTTRYKITKLVHYEYFDHVEDAIKREKQIKSWSRAKKLNLIETTNPEWLDLYPDIIDKDSDTL